MAGLVMADIRSPPEWAQNGPGVDRHCAVLHGFAYLVLYRSADWSRPPDKRMLVVATGMLALYGSLTLSQAMERVTRAFYGRADLDLILSSPVVAWRLFAVRIGAITVTVAVISLALAAPFINVLSWFGGARWLAAYGARDGRSHGRNHAHSRDFPHNRS